MRGFIPKQLQNLGFDLRESSRGFAIVSRSILSQYGPTYDRLTTGLCRSQNGNKLMKRCTRIPAPSVLPARYCKKDQLHK
jgi:hypothetical protein